MNVFSFRCSKPVGIEALEKFKDIQVIDSRYVAGKEHIESAVSQTEKAFERGENISNNFFIEVLVRASAQKQIKKAFKLFGVSNSKDVVVICDKYPEEFVKLYCCTESAIKMDERRYNDVKRVFGVEEVEINAAGRSKFEALWNIIRERIALVSAV